MSYKPGTRQVAASAGRKAKQVSFQTYRSEIEDVYPRLRQLKTGYKYVELLFILRRDSSGCTRAFVITCPPPPAGMTVNHGIAEGRPMLHDALNVRPVASQPGLTVTQLEVDQLFLEQGRRNFAYPGSWHIKGWLRSSKARMHGTWRPASVSRHFLELHGRILFATFEWLGEEHYADQKDEPRLGQYDLYMLKERQLGYEGESIGPTIRVTREQARRFGESIQVAYMQPDKSLEGVPTRVLYDTRKKPSRLFMDVIPKFARSTRATPIMSSAFYTAAARRRLVTRL